jgi:uncharacterized membrane protein
MNQGASVEMPNQAARKKWHVLLALLWMLALAAVFAAYLRPAFLMDITLFSQLCS